MKSIGDGFGTQVAPVRAQEDAVKNEKPGNIRGGCPDWFWLASEPMMAESHPLEIGTGLTQKAWNTRSFLVLSQLERRAPGRPHG